MFAIVLAVFLLLFTGISLILLVRPSLSTQNNVAMRAQGAEKERLRWYTGSEPFFVTDGLTKESEASAKEVNLSFLPLHELQPLLAREAHLV
jgi:hypothetical protein